VGNASFPTPLSDMGFIFMEAEGEGLEPPCP
jgi:hypothetical protein